MDRLSIMEGTFHTNSSDVMLNNLRAWSKHSLIVNSAGNGFPAKIDSTDAVAPSILVGATNSDGSIFSGSQEGKSVVISAPSSSMDPQSMTNEQTIINGKVAQFGMTSGAAPLVTGALSDAESLTPGLTLEEAKFLLRNTAIPASGFVDGRQLDGAGVVNAYKMTRVAASLAEGWPGNRALISDPKTYDFSNEANKDYSDALNALQAGLSCDNEAKAFSKLREAFFLDPNNPSVRTELALIYSANGYSNEAKYYGLPKMDSNSSLFRAFASGLTSGDASSVQRGIQNHIDINQSIGGMGGNMPPLGWAMIFGNVQIVKLLLDQHAQIDQDRAFSWAAQSCTENQDGSLKMMQMLVDSGTKPPIALSSDAVTCGRAAVSFLLDHGASASQLVPNFNVPPIFLATQYPGDLGLVQLLKDKGTDADLKKTDFIGKTVLQEIDSNIKSARSPEEKQFYSQCLQILEK